MLQILTHLSVLRGDRKGVTTIEYAILAFAIIGVVAGMALLIEGSLSDAFTAVGTRLTSATTPGT